MSQRLAVIDIGTNTIILLIVELNADGSFQPVHDEACVVRLGEGINDHKKFLPQAMDRAHAALTNFRKTIDSHKCDRISVVGTAGFRNASNANEFIERVAKTLNLHITVISGEREAELIHLASSHDFHDLPKPQLTIDIGGGSTEFVFDHQSGLAARSLAIGSVKLNERFFSNDPPTPQEIIKLDQYLYDQLKNLSCELDDIPSAQAGSQPQLIATAGTATTLAAIIQKLDVYDPNVVHKSLIKTDVLEKMVEHLGKIPAEERRHLPGMTPLRADVIVAGGRLLLAIANYFSCKSIWISDRGLRYGVVYELLMRS